MSTHDATSPTEVSPEDASWAAEATDEVVRLAQAGKLPEEAARRLRACLDHHHLGLGIMPATTPARPAIQPKLKDASKRVTPSIRDRIQAPREAVETDS